MTLSRRMLEHGAHEFRGLTHLSMSSIRMRASHSYSCLLSSPRYAESPLPLQDDHLPHIGHALMRTQSKSPASSMTPPITTPHASQARLVLRVAGRLLATSLAYVGIDTRTVLMILTFAPAHLIEQPWQTIGLWTRLRSSCGSGTAVASCRSCSFRNGRVLSRTKTREDATPPLSSSRQATGDNPAAARRERLEMPAARRPLTVDVPP
ncbi:hypothetical protein OH77DRAFT_1424389 [Trametes cingulata]|nr:hypothetical protein OH77DRAFT_1424389 [Trametes cingulata]